MIMNESVEIPCKSSDSDRGLFTIKEALQQ